MDGTLVDSNALHARAWQDTFEHFGIQVSFDEALHQIGKGGDQLIPVFVAEEDVPRLEEPIKQYRKTLFETQYFDKIKAFPGCRDLLIKMKNAGLRVALASSASQSDLAKLKEIAGITDLVEQETSKDDAHNSKPSPDIFQATLERLKLDPLHAIALGDTPWDIQAAGKAGLSTVAVTSGGWKEEELKEAGAIEVYQNVGTLAINFDRSAFFR